MRWYISQLLTVIVPVYNEESTINELLRSVITAPYANKEVIVVDDCSDDRTQSILKLWNKTENLRILRHAKNRGKGAAVRTAIELAMGQVIVIQDADLEYDPKDYPLLVEPILNRESEVVYGSRYLTPSTAPRTLHRVAVMGLNLLVRLLYGYKLTDEATCYKAMRAELWRSLDLKAERFELCAEVTAKICRIRIPIREVAIRYKPRAAAEGKKIGWRDIWPTVWTLISWRFRTFHPAYPMPPKKLQKV